VRAELSFPRDGAGRVWLPIERRRRLPGFRRRLAEREVEEVELPLRALSDVRELRPIFRRDELFKQDQDAARTRVGAWTWWYRIRAVREWNSPEFDLGIV
jgi:hypothetical protein